MGARLLCTGRRVSWLTKPCPSSFQVPPPIKQASIDFSAIIFCLLADCPSMVVTGGRLDELFLVNSDHAKLRCREQWTSACSASHALAPIAPQGAHECLTAPIKTFDHELAESRERCRQRCKDDGLAADWVEEVLREEAPKMDMRRQEIFASAIFALGCCPAPFALPALLFPGDTSFPWLILTRRRSLLKWKKSKITTHYGSKSSKATRREGRRSSRRRCMKQRSGESR
eukprot:797435-Rhodomonas_salina.1